ncbi:hypothetical protein N665_0007s0043 [Sinapis alba]|nr:hypothetical protein N665_0007s0043 [Sinapis alba]
MSRCFPFPANWRSSSEGDVSSEIVEPSVAEELGSRDVESVVDGELGLQGAAPVVVRELGWREEGLAGPSVVDMLVVGSGVASVDPLVIGSGTRRMVVGPGVASVDLLVVGSEEGRTGVDPLVVGSGEKGAVVDLLIVGSGKGRMSVDPPVAGLGEGPAELRFGEAVDVSSFVVLEEGEELEFGGELVDLRVVDESERRVDEWEPWSSLDTAAVGDSGFDLNERCLEDPVSRSLLDTELIGDLVLGGRHLDELTSRDSSMAKVGEFGIGLASSQFEMLETSDGVADRRRDGVELLSNGLSMKERRAAADKFVAEKEAVVDSSTSSESSSEEGSSSSSSEGSSSSSFLSDRHVVEGLVDEERDVVDGPTLGIFDEDVAAVAESGVVEPNTGGDGGVAASDEYERVSAGEFSEVKGASFDFSYPSQADYSSTIDLVDGEMEQKIKKSRKKSCRMGPFLDHPRDSKSSIVMAAKLEWITASCCTDGSVEVRLPGPDERPWTVPDGWVFLYDFWFLEYHLWFPLPRLLLAYCDERRIALSQLAPGSIRNVVGALVLAAECGVHMSLYFLEEIIKITPGETYETFYLSMNSGRCFVKEERRKTLDWIHRFFYVRITSSSVSDMSRPLMTSWNPYHDRHTVGVPFAPGYKECLAYVEDIGIQNWKLVDRARVLRCVVFIATWEVRSRMDFSEFPSLSGCFAGGSVTDVAAIVGDGAGASAGVGVLASAPGVVVGLATAPASFVQSADRRREGCGASERLVVAGGKKGGDSKKRPADGSLAKEASSSKLRKVTVTTKDAPPPSGAPLVGGVSMVDGGEIVFQPFECAFGGTVEDCGELFKKLRMVGDDEGCPLDTSERSEWYIKYARHTTIAAKYVNRLVNNQDAELKVVAAELAKANGKLAAAKGGADRTGEIAAWRKMYEAERKVSLAAQEEVKNLTTRMVLDAERAKKRQVMEEERYQKGKEMLHKRYDRAIARHDDVLATCNSRVAKVRRFVDDQKVVRQAMYGVNQIHGVLDAVKVWRSEGIKILESKVKHLEGKLDVRTRAASLLVPVALEEKELALIPSFDFSVPLDPVLPSLTEGVEEAALVTEKEEARRRSDVDRRRSSDREGTRRDGGAPSRSTDRVDLPVGFVASIDDFVGPFWTCFSFMDDLFVLFACASFVVFVIVALVSVSAELVALFESWSRISYAKQI